MYGAAGPGFWHMPKSSPEPYARVFGAVRPIYNVHFMNGGVFGCRKSLCVVFVHVRGSLTGNITNKLAALSAQKLFWQERFFGATATEHPGLRQRSAVDSSLPKAQAFDNFPAVSTGTRCHSPGFWAIVLISSSAVCPEFRQHWAFGTLLPKSPPVP